MCGIFGTTIDVNTDQLNSTRVLLDHRGPDSHGTERLVSKNGRALYFQHTRLAIQDLSSSGHQPMTSQCGRWAITFNGEIYNHGELRKSLSLNFHGTSDTETLVEYIACNGIEQTVNKLNGIFAFSALDKENCKLYLVRDPFGIKPMYFVTKDRQLSFSSEIKPLLDLLGKMKINLDGLGNFLALRYSPSPETLLDGVDRLPPGHIGEYDLEKSELTLSCYVDSTTDQYQGTLNEAVEEYHHVLGDAVQRQLIGDVPVGILLSGGIDSALVAQYSKDHPGITGYTVGFGDKYDDCEIADARETASTLGINHQYVDINPEALIQELPAIVKAIEEPLGTTSIMAMWSLTQLAKQGVTVALTGQGSDEPWGGYRRYKIEHLLNSYPILDSKLFQPLQGIGGYSRSEAIRRGTACLGVGGLAERFSKAYALFDDNQIKQLLPSKRNSVVPKIQEWLNWLPESAKLSSAEKMMRVDTRMNLADDLLLYGDKISMAFALEARVPMLDVNLVRFVESLPIGFRSTFKQTKIVHKLTAQRYLPAHIVNRKKKGFQVPFGEWSRGIWKSDVEDQLLDSGSSLRNFVPRDAVETIWQQHLSGKRDFSKQVFALLTLSIWAKAFL